MPEVSAPQPPAVTYIYALVDPRDGRIRYVGKADDPQRRFERHVFDGGHPAYCANRHKVNWLRQLAEAGLEPTLRLLEETTPDRWQEREIRWIEDLRRQGEPLTNAASGGMGGPGPSAEQREILRERRIRQNRDPEFRAKVSEALRGRTFSPESRAKMSAAQKVREYRPPPRTPEQIRAFVEAANAAKKRPEVRANYRAEQARRRAERGITIPVVVRLTCALCDTEFERKSKALAKNQTGEYFCCTEHAYEFRRRDWPPAKCAWCDKALTPKGKRGGGSVSGRRFCGPACVRHYHYAVLREAACEGANG